MRRLVLVVLAFAAAAVSPVGAQTGPTPTVVDFESGVDGRAPSPVPPAAFSNALVLAAGVSLNEFEYPPHSGANVAFDTGGTLTITFERPARAVSASFTYSRALTVTAKDGAGATLGAVQSAFAHNEALSGEAGSKPNETITVTSSSGIASLIVEPAGGAFVLDDLTFTVPPSEITYTLAEGATAPFFDLDVTVANPNGTAARLDVSFLRPGGLPPVPLTLTLQAFEQRTIRVNDVADLANTAVSTVVRSGDGLPLAVERTMFWPRDLHYGGHGGTAVEAPARTWYFAEGSQGFFDTFVLLANSGLTPANVNVTFLRENDVPVVVNVPLPAQSREDVWAATIPDLANRSFSVVVDSDVAINAERAMYFPAGQPAPGSRSRLWEGGHEAAGVTSLATSWFLAEGATGPFFDLYVLVGNPGTADAQVTYTFLLGTGETVVARQLVPAMTRVTVNVDNVRGFVDAGFLTLVSGDPNLLSDAAVSTTITSDMPVVAERAMYWPGDSSTWYEAHDSFGATQTAARWALAEGRVGGSEAFETYVLLANPTTSTATVRVTLLRQNGRPTLAREFTVPPTSRFNVYVNDADWAALGLENGEGFGALVESINAVPIAVERAMYWTLPGQFWTGGTSTTATKLP